MAVPLGGGAAHKFKKSAQQGDLLFAILKIAGQASHLNAQRIRFASLIQGVSGRLDSHSKRLCKSPPRIGPESVM